MRNSLLIGLFTALAVVLCLLPFLGLLQNDSNTITLTSRNLLVLSGEINGESTSALIKQAESQSRKFSGPLYLFLNTPGGEIQTGLELIEALRGLSRPVHTVSLFSASMGFQLVQSLGDRLVLKNSTLMSHRARGSFEGYFGGKHGSQLDSRYYFWLQKLNELDEQTAQRSKGKQTLDSYQKAYADELWLTGSQAVNGGYADRIVTVRCDSTLNGVTTHTVEFLGAHVLYDLDNCPINTSPMNLRIVMPEQKTPAVGPRAEQLKTEFIEQYTEKQHAVIPMAW